MKEGIEMKPRTVRDICVGHIEDQNYELDVKNMFVCGSCVANGSAARTYDECLMSIAGGRPIPLRFERLVFGMVDPGMRAADAAIGEIPERVRRHIFVSNCRRVLVVIFALCGMAIGKSSEAMHSDWDRVELHHQENA